MSITYDISSSIGYKKVLRTVPSFKFKETHKSLLAGSYSYQNGPTCWLTSIETGTEK